MNLNCPACNSENTQRLSVIHESGISTINTKSNGIVTGVGHHGAGVGSLHKSTKGTSQTAASQKAAPPEKKKYIGPLFLILLLGVLAAALPIQSGFLRSIIGYIWAAASIWWIFHAFQYNRKVWPALKAAWDDTFLCQRCNHVFFAA